MVEKSHTSGFWPSLYDPFRQLGERVSEWLAPASEASGDDDAYRIAVELPGVEEGDIHLITEKNNRNDIMENTPACTRGDRAVTLLRAGLLIAARVYEFKLPRAPRFAAVCAASSGGRFGRRFQLVDATL